MKQYLKCGHCGCEFLPTDRQWKRSRSRSHSKDAFCCSKTCFSALLKRPKGIRTPRYRIECRCGKIFLSRYERKFCSIKCYTSSPEFLERMATQLPRANEIRILRMTGELPHPKEEVTCLQCGRVEIRPYKKSGHKFCSKRCYRAYMAARFDRWIAAPQTIALPQGYDEFLSQNELPCLVDGCNWVGKGLGAHVNFSHGIPVEEFKRAAGFNLSTGLVSADLAQSLSERTHIHEAEFGPMPTIRTEPPVRHYHSLEGREHRAKSTALTVRRHLEARTCPVCGGMFDPKPGGFNAIYCSHSCRARAQYQRDKASKGVQKMKWLDVQADTTEGGPHEVD